MLCFLGDLLSPRFDLSHVFGIEVGKDSPAAIVRKFGGGVGEIRHYWKPLDHSYSRDDGWHWYEWNGGNAEVQVYWEPAFPKRNRKVTRIWITEPMSPAKYRLSAIFAGNCWLRGIKLGMPESPCLKLLTRRLGPCTSESGTYCWQNGQVQLRVHCEASKLTEMSVDVL